MRGLGGSEERLSRILGATALPGRRLWEEEPLRGSCILRGWVQPASLRSGSSPTPPRVPFPSHLLLPNTCSLPAQVRGLHGPPPPWSPPPAPGTEQELLIVPNLPTCSASLRVRGAREPPEMLHFTHQPRGGRDPCSVIRLWGGRDLAMPVSHKCTSSPCQAHWGGQPGDTHDLRSGSPMSIYNVIYNDNKTPTEGRPTERRGIPAHVGASCSCGKEPASSEHSVEAPRSVDPEKRKVQNIVCPLHPCATEAGVGACIPTCWPVHGSLREEVCNRVCLLFALGAGGASKPPEFHR